MTLISLEFLLFFIVVMTVYYLLPGKVQWIWLLITSLYFYFSISTTSQFIEFLLIILINWVAALFMNENSKNRKIIYVSTLIFDIFALSLFKYSRFFFDIFVSIGHLVHINLEQTRLVSFVYYTEAYAPLRISYFALIIIGYITDVYWGKNQPQKNLGKLMLFTGYFPQMTSGPIVTYEQMDGKLWGEKHRFSYDTFVLGMERVIWGVFKKIVISERCGVIVNSVYSYYEAYGGLYVFIAAAMFAMQLYCDFSGLMDIVLGFSQCLGVALPENFDTPFYSLNLSEFWRRWHITLGGFLRDYVLYPVQRSKMFKNLRKKCKEKFGKGYEKKFNLPLYLSLLISWFLIGLWHGGGWNYIFGVGLYMWLVIVLGEIFSPILTKLVDILHINTDCTSYRLFLRIRTFILFMFGLSFFRASSLRSGFAMWKSAFSVFNPWILFDESLYKMGLDRREWGILVFGIILLFIVSYIHQKIDVREWLCKQNLIFRLIVFSILFICIITWGYYGLDFNAADFIYGRF